MLFQAAAKPCLSSEQPQRCRFHRLKSSRLIGRESAFHYFFMEMTACACCFPSVAVITICFPASARITAIALP